jgi:hypothetical protein
MEGERRPRRTRSSDERPRRRRGEGDPRSNNRPRRTHSTSPGEEHGHSAERLARHERRGRSASPERGPNSTRAGDGTRSVEGISGRQHHRRRRDGQHSSSKSSPERRRRREGGHQHTSQLGERVNTAVIGTPSARPLRSASPRFLHSELLASPQPSDREPPGVTPQGIDLSQIDHPGPRDGDGGNNDDGETATPHSVRGGIDGGETATEVILRKAAARDLERQQHQRMRMTRRGSELLDRKDLAELHGLNGATPATAGRRASFAPGLPVDVALDTSEKVDYIVDASGNFRLVPRPDPNARRDGARVSERMSTGGIFSTAVDEDIRFRAGRRAGLAPMMPAQANKRRPSFLKSMAGRFFDRRQASQDQALEFARRHKDYEPGQPTHGIRLTFWRIQKAIWFRLTVLLCIITSAFFLATEYPANPGKTSGYLYTEMGLNAIFTLEFFVKIIALVRAGLPPPH